MSEWIIRFLSEAGYSGIILLMILEHIFPPIPSELIMPFAGFAASQGKLSLSAVIAAGTLGSTLGTTVWYLTARRLGLIQIRRFAEQYGKWMTVSVTDIDGAEAWFKRRGVWAILLGRLMPAVRTLISVPAGLISMPFLPFLFYTTMGTLVWTSFLTGAGYWLGENYSTMSRFIDPITNLVVALVVISYFYRVVQQHSGQP
jgi:membrane protein DedA with SNARE-associated domain